MRDIPAISAESKLCRVRDFSYRDDVIGVHTKSHDDIPFASFPTIPLPPRSVE